MNEITNKQVNITFRVRKDINRKIDIFAQKWMVKKSEFLRRLIEKELKELEKRSGYLI